MRNLIIILFVAFTTGCGVGSIYTSSYYSETSLEDDLIRVTFKGGSPPLTGDFCLLRCSEVAISKGKKYFQVVDSESGNSFHSYPSRYPFHNYHMHNDPFVEDIPHVTKTIRLLDDEPEKEFVYEASIVWSSIRKKYELVSE